MKIKVYISGAISSLPYDEAKEMFNKKEIELQSQNFEVVNPFNNGEEKDAPWAAHMRADIKALLDCDCIYMLKTWENSKGARLEHNIAYELGMGVIYQTEK
ncbi:DUF4406 domain-containing protein [Dysgonomonas sp. Marseille-P4361]|uniref:DUF4406 domain-containing protein n=1 Tax=Dysgonomonas sp. Marseille-P4361 TaxID=2161820 RepID=UPI000D559A50|nr:DUF4406 domain-containing protein [Dysgonomonas sp. Marseille-P4361]